MHPPSPAPTDWTLERLTVGPLMMNAYLLASESAGEALLIDPGDESETLLDAVATSGCRLVGLLATHGHFDHISAAAEIQSAWDLPLTIHPAERPLVDRLNDTRAFYGFPPVSPPRLADLPNAETGRLPFAGGDLRWAHAPGHSPGHVVWSYGRCALVGDVIFAGSIGRTDLPGGDFETLADSIRRSVYTLDDETVLHSGHGPETTVGEERRSNPFVRG